MATEFEGIKALLEDDRRRLKQKQQRSQSSDRRSASIAKGVKQPQAQAQQSTSEAESEKAFDHKVLLLGPGGAGKSSIFDRYTLDVHERTDLKPVLDFVIKREDVDGVKVDLSLYDVAGDEKSLRELRTVYCKDAGSLVYVFDHKQFNEQSIEDAVSSLNDVF